MNLIDGGCSEVWLGRSGGESIPVLERSLILTKEGVSWASSELPGWSTVATSRSGIETVLVEGCLLVRISEIFPLSVVVVPHFLSLLSTISNGGLSAGSTRARVGNSKLSSGQTGNRVETVLVASGDLLDHFSVIRADLAVVLELEVGVIVGPEAGLDIATISGVVSTEQLGLALLSVDTLRLVDLEVAAGIVLDDRNSLTGSLSGDARVHTVSIADVLWSTAADEINNAKTNLASLDLVPGDAFNRLGRLSELLWEKGSVSFKWGVAGTIADSPVSVSCCSGGISSAEVWILARSAASGVSSEVVVSSKRADNVGIRVIVIGVPLLWGSDGEGSLDVVAVVGGIGNTVLEITGSEGVVLGGGRAELALRGGGVVSEPQACVGALAVGIGSNTFANEVRIGNFQTELSRVGRIEVTKRERAVKFRIGSARYTAFTED